MFTTHKIQGAGGAGGDSYWIALLGGTGDDYGGGPGGPVAVDSAGDIIVCGFTQSVGAGGWDFLTVKYDSSGTLQWSRALGGSGIDQAQGVAVDSSDNIIVVGITNSDGAGSNDFLIAKYNSSGVLQWDKTLGGSGSELSYGIAIDSFDNIIVCGYTGSDGAGGNDFLIAKYNSSGTLQWDRTLGGSGNDLGYAVAVDPSDNIIVCGLTQSDGAGGSDALIAKYNSSGTLQWDRTLGGAADDSLYDVAIDSSDNIIVGGFTASAGGGLDTGLLAKYNSSGVLQWDKVLGGTGYDYIRGVTVDSSDNIIVCGATNSDGAGGYDALIAKLPSDGSGDGTYGSLTYGDASLTDAAAVLTDAPAVLTDAAAVLTDAAAVLTDQSVTLTEELFEVTP